MSTTVTTSINTWGKPNVQAGTVRAYERGRKCAHPECDTLLSMYNPTKYCSAHVQLARSRRRGEARPIREVACAHCGASFQTGNPNRRFCSDRCRMASFARRKRAAQRAEARLRRQEAQGTAQHEELVLQEAA